MESRRVTVGVDCSGGLHSEHCLDNMGEREAQRGWRRVLSLYREL